MPMDERKPCSKCGEEKPLHEFARDKRKTDGHGSACKACKAAATRDYYQQNPERRREYMLVYRRENAEQLRAYRRKYVLDHSETFNAWRREYEQTYRQQHAEMNNARQRRFYAANIERIRQQKAEYRKKNRALLRRRWRAWQRAHPDAGRTSSSNYRARKRAAEGAFTTAEWQALKTFYNHTCLCCGRKEPEITLTPDHVIPLAQGGGNAITNLQPLCLDCNRRKNNKAIDYR